jgi:uncharacterized membrane protein
MNDCIFTVIIIFFCLFIFLSTILVLKYLSIHRCNEDNNNEDDNNEDYNNEDYNNEEINEDDNNEDDNNKDMYLIKVLKVIGQITNYIQKILNL